MAKKISVSQKGKALTLDYVVCHACVEDDSATAMARDMVNNGYQPWGIASISVDTLSKSLQWVQVFVKKQQEEE